MKFKLLILKNKFPRISRFITERTVYERAAIILSLILIIATGFIGYQLYINFQEKQKLDEEREKISREIEYWQGIIGKYKNFRDAYFMLSVLEYRLKNAEKAKDYLQRVFELDPNFEEGRKLEKVIRN